MPVRASLATPDRVTRLCVVIPLQKVINAQCRSCSFTDLLPVTSTIPRLVVVLTLDKDFGLKQLLVELVTSFKKKLLVRNLFNPKSDLF